MSNHNTRNRTTTFLTLATFVALTLLATSAQAQLVLHLPLNDGPAGSTLTSTGGAAAAIDDGGHGTTSGTVNGTPNNDTWVNNATRQSIVLSTGEGSRLNIGTQDINNGNLFAWSTWANVAFSNIADAGADTIMGNRNGGNTWFKLSRNGIGANSFASAGIAPDLADDTWHHVVVTGDTGSRVAVYVDGVFNAQDTSLGTTPMTSPFYIGGNPSFSEDITGLMSDLGVWDEGLSADEVKGLFDVSNHGGAGLLYDAAEFDLLKQVHDAGSGSVVIGDLTWSFASSLTDPAGLTGLTLVLDSTADTGLIGVAPIPEPSTFVLALLGMLSFAGWRRRRR